MQPTVIAAGGTGGHFFPAEALAAELVARGHRIVLMTDARSGGLSSATFAGREQYVIRGAGIAGRGLWRGLTAAGSLAAGMVQARGILARIGAGCVVGFGGYPCVAPVLAAAFMRRRPAVILHEQNAVLGRANRFLASRADVLALGFEATERIPPGTRTEVTGNPVRPAIAALARTSYVAASDRIRLLVLGGSLGARVLSDVVPAALGSLPDRLRARLSVVQQTRPEDLDRVRAAYAAHGIAAELSPFFADVAARLLAAHLVIARAGASTVAELAVAGRPAILGTAAERDRRSSIGQRPRSGRGGRRVDRPPATVYTGAACRTADRVAGGPAAARRRSGCRPKPGSRRCRRQTGRPR